MINNFSEKSKDILNVLFGLNIIFLLISIWKINNGLTVTYLFINIIFLGIFLLIEKYGHLFEAIIKGNKLFKLSNEMIGKL